MRSAFSTANTTTLMSHVPSAHSRFCEFHELVAQQVPTVSWKSEQTAELTQSHKAKTATAHTHTQKPHNLSHRATKLVYCREHCVGGKGVILTAVSTVQCQPTWQSVSLLIGLILGRLLQDLTVRIIIYVTDVTSCCATSHTKAFFVLYMSPLHAHKY